MSIKNKEFIEDRKCNKCGKTGNYKDIPYRYYDNREIWDRKTFLCKRCKAEDYNNERKSIIDFNTGNLDKNSSSGKGIIGEVVVAKVRNIDILSIKFNNFTLILDLSFDKEYGNIQVKIRMWRLKRKGNWKCGAWSSIGFDVAYDFDTLFVICISKDGNNIDRIYAIPRDELSGITGITIYENTSPSRGSKWEKFRIGEKIYNENYHSIMSFLRDKKYFGIEDIKKWMEL